MWGWAQKEVAQAELGCIVNVPSCHAVFRHVVFVSWLCLLSKVQWTAVLSWTLARHKSMAFWVVSHKYWAGLMQSCWFCPQGFPWALPVFFHHSLCLFSEVEISSRRFLPARLVSVRGEGGGGGSLWSWTTAFPFTLICRRHGMWCKLKNVSRFHLLPIDKGIWNPWASQLFRFCKDRYWLSLKNSGQANCWSGSCWLRSSCCFRAAGFPQSSLTHC